MLNFVDLTKLNWDICSIIDLKKAANGKIKLNTIDLKNVQ